MLIKFLYSIKLFLLKIYSATILFTNSEPNVTERVIMFLKSLLFFLPFAAVLENLQLWFCSNYEFVNGTIFIIGINMLFGAWMHYRKEDFDWETFFEKTLTMIIAVILVYMVLELIILFSGTTQISTAFRVVLQVSTLLYPGSKILKNVHILTKGEHPPKFIMKRLYNFEKNGDLNDLLKNKKD